MRVACEFRAGMVVNLGIGLPTLVSDYIPEDGSVLAQAENGVVGYGPFPPEGQGDPNLVDAGGQMVSQIRGAAFMHHSDAFAIIRGGHIDISVLGGLQVSEKGDLANWLMPGRALGSPGGAVDLVTSARRVIALMEHTTRDGQPKVLRRCTLPLTGSACVNLVITDVAVMEVTPEGLLLREVAPGWTAQDVQDITEAPLIVASDLREVQLEGPALARVSKMYSSAEDAIAGVFDGAVVMIDGPDGVPPDSIPERLVRALQSTGVRDLTIVSSTLADPSTLVENGQVRKVVASSPEATSPQRPTALELSLRDRKIQVELTSRATLAERIRAGGAGIAGFYMPAGPPTSGKETRVIDGREYVLEYALRADFALIHAHKADALGNLVYREKSSAFSAVMATAADITVVEADNIVEPGEIDPELVATPSLYVDRIYQR